MTLDLKQGFGDLPQYNLFKFPDNSIKFILKSGIEVDSVSTTFRTNDDIIAILMVSDVLARKQASKVPLYINYMMYQQDDRQFNDNESFGLKVISKLLNTLYFSNIIITAPHSDKVELIDNVRIVDNTEFIKDVLTMVPRDITWVIPDSGAFKTQAKQIEKLYVKKFVTCMKSRDPQSGELTQEVATGDLQGADCIIFDDICLGGRTFVGIAAELKKKNAGKLYLAITHGIFNQGLGNLSMFEEIFTTDSICDLKPNNQLKIIKL